MHLKLVITIAIFAACLLSSGCKKETDDTCATDPSQCPPPDLCAETDNCDDGILNDFLRSWSRWVEILKDSPC